MEKMMAGRSLVGVTAAASSSAGRIPRLAEGLRVPGGRGSLSLLRVGSGSSTSLASRTAFSGSKLSETAGAVRLWRDNLSGRFVGQELRDFSVQRRTVVKSCVVSWLLMCTAAMTDTARAQPSGTGSDSAVGTVIFYNYALAFNPAKARLALEEKGIKYTEKKIDLFNGQSLEPWYLKLNPNSTAPTLVVGNEKITESLDIIKWVDRQGTPLGGDSVDRAFVNEWLSKVDAWDGNLFTAANSGAGGALKFSIKFKIKVAEANAKRNPDMAGLYKEKISTMEKSITDSNDKASAESNYNQLVSLLDEAETRLATNKFLAGDAYSTADAIFTPVIYRIFFVKKEKELLDPRPNIKRYYEELKKRPSYKKVFSVSDSGLSTAQTVLPAVGKILFSKVTGKY